MAGVIDWLDDYGRAAWITAMVLGFILFWPIGLAILAFLIWSGRIMGCGGRHGGGDGWRQRFAERWDRKRDKWERKMQAWRAEGPAAPSSGNRAFDEYRAETMRRLQDEEREFHDFLGKLRMAKDRAEFDQFMADRRARPASAPQPEPPAAA